LKVNGIRHKPPRSEEFLAGVKPRRHLGTPWAQMDSLDIIQML
jgi:hypothetical protein